jgi:hypothetical protein
MEVDMSTSEDRVAFGTNGPNTGSLGASTSPELDIEMKDVGEAVFRPTQLRERAAPETEDEDSNGDNAITQAEEEDSLNSLIDQRRFASFSINNHLSPC